MTWFHIYYLLRAHNRLFPHGDIRPFAPVPADWLGIEVMFRQEESQTRSSVEAAALEYIHCGSWPSELSEREKVFIRDRLDFRSHTAPRLAVLVSEDIIGARSP